MADLSTLSDAELQALYGKSQASAPPPVADLGALSDADLLALHQKAVQPPQPSQAPSTAADVAKSAGSGLATGAAGVIGLPADIPDLARRAVMWPIARGAEKLGLMPTSVADALIQGPPDAASERPGAETIGRLIKSTAGDYDYTPQTPEGKYVKTISEFAPGALTMAGGLRQVPGALVKFGAIPGAASEAAGQQFSGTDAEPYARLVGAMAGLGPAAAFSFRGAPKEVVAQAVQGMSPQQRIETEMLMASAASKGSPISLAEAVQYVTGNGTRLGDAQRVIEQTANGGPIMKEFFAPRPANNDQMVRSSLDQVSPTISQPFENAPRVQRGAQRAVDNANDQVNSASRAAYEATSNDPSVLLSDTGFGKLTGNAAIEQGIKAVRGDPVKYGDLRGMPDNSLTVLDATKKYLNDVAEAAAQAGEKFGAKNAGDAATLVRDAMVSEYPRYGSALNIQSMGKSTLVEPLERSATGQLAAAEKFPEQARVIFNPNPLAGSEGDIGNAIRTVAKSDPEAANEFVRQFVERTFNETTQNLVAGPNQWGGAKFAAVLEGNPQQAKNLEAAVRALPGGDAKWNELRGTLDVLKAQGTRQAPGSMTEANRLMTQELMGGTPGGAAAARLASPSTWPGLALDLAQRFRYGRNTGQMADMLTSQNPGVLDQLAKYPIGSRAQASLIAALIEGRTALGGGGSEPLLTVSPSR